MSLLISSTSHTDRTSPISVNVLRTEICTDKTIWSYKVVKTFKISLKIGSKTNDYFFDPDISFIISLELHWINWYFEQNFHIKSVLMVFISVSVSSILCTIFVVKNKSSLMPIKIIKLLYNAIWSLPLILIDFDRVLCRL